jgi:hypothetical protein
LGETFGIAASMVSIRFEVLGWVLKNSGGAPPPEEARISCAPIMAGGPQPA